MNDSDFGLAGIDTTIVLLYLAGVLAIGTYFGRFVKNAGDFFIAGKALPFWAVGMSIVVSDIGFAALRRPTSGQSGVEGLGLFVGVIRASH